MIEGGRNQSWNVDRSNYWCMVVKSMRRSDDFGTVTRRNSSRSSRITLRFPWPVGTVTFFVHKRLLHSLFPCTFNCSVLFLQLNNLLRCVITQHRFLVALSAQIRHTRTILLCFSVDSCPIMGDDCSKIFE